LREIGVVIRLVDTFDFDLAFDLAFFAALTFGSSS